MKAVSDTICAFGEGGGGTMKDITAENLAKCFEARWLLGIEWRLGVFWEYMQGLSFSTSRRHVNPVAVALPRSTCLEESISPNGREMIGYLQQQYGYSKR